MEISIIKIRWSSDHLIFVTEISIPVKTVLDYLIFTKEIFIPGKTVLDHLIFIKEISIPVKTVLDHLIFTKEISIPGKTVFILRQPAASHVARMVGPTFSQHGANTGENCPVNIYVVYCSVGLLRIL